MDSVEKLRQRKDVERNVADEDVEKLVVFSYNGKGYDCITCGFMLLKDTVSKYKINWGKLCQSIFQLSVPFFLNGPIFGMEIF